MPRPYSLSKSRQILISYYRMLSSRALQDEARDQLTALLENLEEAILKKDRLSAYSYAQQIQHLYPRQTRPWKELIKAIALAAVAAISIRQFWFELYEVPTGSMRPTIFEQDRMIVSKSSFGLRLPFTQRQLGFDENIITRGSLVVFSVDNMPVKDADTLYFGIFPGKKRFIKRCIGKPGDTIYFEHGRIYGVDKNDQLIPLFSSDDEREKYHLSHIHHVPFISFEGNTVFSHQNTTTTGTFYQMNLPCGKISCNSLLQDNPCQSGQFYLHQKWIPDQPQQLKYDRSSPVSYADLFGILHYGMAKIVPHHKPNTSFDTPVAYLVIYHTPNTTYPYPTIYPGNSYFHIYLNPYRTQLPLFPHHIDRIQQHLTTSRFCVTNQQARRYSYLSSYTTHAIYLPNVPDGTYEYIDGTAYKILPGGLRKPVAHDHPLYQFDHNKIIELFNCGIHFNPIYHISNSPSLLPARYAYFHDHDLYVMDCLLMSQDDPILQNYLQQEVRKQKNSSEQHPYIGFTGTSLLPKEGDARIDFIKQFGIRVPDKHIMVLGDNYAMSADSRDFGFVPTKNLLGTPVWKFWPYNVIGPLNQVNMPTSAISYVINGLCIALILFWIGNGMYQRKRIFFKKNRKQS